MSILFNSLIIFAIVIIISVAYYFASDTEIIYLLKNYDFVDNKGNRISYSDFNLTNGFWSGAYNPKNLYIYDAVSDINGTKSKVVIESNAPDSATINGVGIVYDSNKNVMLFDPTNDPESENDPEVNTENIMNITKKDSIFIGTDGKRIPITLNNDGTWIPKNIAYTLAPKGLATTLNNAFRTVFSIPLLIIPIVLEVIAFIL